MKYSFVAVFSVLFCFVYGQLPVDWNINPYGYRPYVGFSPATDRNLAIIASSAQHHIDERSDMQNRGHGGTRKKFIEDFRTELSNTNAKVEDLARKLETFTCTCPGNDPTSISRIPTSCQDLKDVGNTKSGLYSIMGSKQVETVYCDFTKSMESTDFQKWIGYQDIKSLPTYFYVQKDQKACSVNPLTFNREITNVGGAMNLGDGYFTAPVRGTYFFSFSALVQFQTTSNILNYVVVTIYLNGVKVAVGQFNEVSPVNNLYYLAPVTVQSTLLLQAGDKVSVGVANSNTGCLFESPGDNTRYTHYNGWLLEEEIVDSL